MADNQTNEYENYTTQTGGRLFSSAMFGFNKEEVLEYLEEIADENLQQQEAAEIRVQELSSRVASLEQNLEAAQESMDEALARSTPEGESEALQAQLRESTEAASKAQQELDTLRAQLEIANEATRQAEEDLQQYKEDLYTVKQQSEWLREEYQNSDTQIAELQRQIEALSAGNPGANDAATQVLRRQLAEADEKIAAQQAQIHELEAKANTGGFGTLSLEEETALRLELEAHRAKLAQQADLEAELDRARGQVIALQQQVQEWEQGGPNEELLSQFEDAQAQLEDIQAEMDELRAQLEEALDYNAEWAEEEAQREIAQNSATSIIEEATAEAEQIRQAAMEERARLHRQIRNSSGGITQSITNLRDEVSGVEGDVSSILESVQDALSDVLLALGRTEQNLATFDTQVDRFPNSAPTVPRPQQVVYFQPTGGELSGQGGAGVATPSYGHSGFQPVAASGSDSGKSYRPFRASYTVSSAAPAVYANGETAHEEKLRALSETLVETLKQMMD